MTVFDLRSDTVTRPTPGMRASMAAAEVGDDVYGEDPTVRRLEEHVAGLLGKEQALFVPSGTMANQIALLLHTRPGDEVVVGEGAHVYWNESGAGSAWAGVQFAVAGHGGFFDAEQLSDAVKPPLTHLPRTRLVALENTHNRAGGRVFPLPLLERVTARARQHGLVLHLDGARLWNAAVASGIGLEVWARPFDTVSVCFSKGLGAPVGSALVGSAELIGAAVRLRKMLGGGMRQAGVLAAAALYAIEHHRSRLADDHEAARALARRLADTPGAHVQVDHVETNMVAIGLTSAEAERVVQLARADGVLIGAMNRRTLRAVTHLDLPLGEAVEAAERLSRCIEAASREGPRP